MAFVQAGDRRLEYFEMGEGGKTVILIHGAGSSAVIWHQVQTLMAEAGFRTVAISLLGAGDSDRTDDVNDYNPDSYARDISRALISMNISDCSLVGHSLGVSNVLSLVCDYGDHLNVRAMILMAGGAGDPKDAPSDEEIEKIVASAQAQDPELAAGRRPGWEKLHLGLTQDVRDRLWRDITSNPPERGIGQRITGRPDRTEFLNTTDIPTLVMSGDNDSVVPLSMTLAMYPKLKKAARGLHVMFGIDHYPNAEAPSEVSRVYVEFLNRYL